MPHDPGSIPPFRVSLLLQAVDHTSGDRDLEYGPPQKNMACAGEFKAVFRKYLARDILPEEQEALDMVMTKLSRLACGKPKADTYVDGAAYFGIAGEMAFPAPTTDVPSRATAIVDSLTSQMRDVSQVSALGMSARGIPLDVPTPGGHGGGR